MGVSPDGAVGESRDVHCCTRFGSCSRYSMDYFCGPHAVRNRRSSRGTARDIIRLAREGMSIRVPVESVGSRDTVISLRREWVDLGESTGLIVESMVPSAIRVSLEAGAQTRMIPVATRFVGRVHDQLALAAPIEVNPRVMRVPGSARFCHEPRLIETRGP